MSRIGKKIIIVPEGIDVKIEGDEFVAKSAKGELRQKLHPKVRIEIKDKQISIKVEDPNNERQKALWGLFGSLIKNMILGLKQGFEKKLEVNGVGYKVSLQGDKLILNLGFSHPVEYKLPKGISGAVDKNIITLSSIDRQLVGETAAQLRQIRKPDPYKGKGIKYADEILRKKVGKAAVKAQ